MKCLIIDDDAFSRDFIVTLLDGKAECHEAENGKDALTKFAAAAESDAPYDLVLLDILMPDMDGHATARGIRSIEKEQGLEVGKRVKIVMLTSLNSPDDAMESFCNAQSAAYLVKPVSKEKLLGVVSKLGLNRQR